MSHYLQYPPGTQKVYSYFESRGGKFDSVVYFGLQYYLQEYLQGTVITREYIDEADAFFQKHFETQGIFNRQGWEHILHKHNGRLPLEIKSVPEGIELPVSHVLMTVENTDPECFWLTSYIETLLVQTWYGSTVATISRACRKALLESLEKTGSPETIDFKLQDFGFRGVSSVESAAIGGAAHLLSFKGTDTLAGCLLAQKYYGADMPGFSIPAAEHSTQTAWGRKNEQHAFEHMLDQFPQGTVAVVSDSWDIMNACKNIWGGPLKEKVLSRQAPVVIRPDSGDPVETVLEVLEVLGQQFGTTTNKKGYKLLPDQLRVIQGDGINYHSLQAILTALERKGWSADNLAFGMGGGLLQKLDRDLQKFAFKCSEITINGQAKEVYKDPVTDPGKKSKPGRLKLTFNGTRFETVAQNSPGQDLLETVFLNGEITKKENWNSMRENSLKPYRI